jgi:hypothetical protein
MAAGLPVADGTGASRKVLVIRLIRPIRLIRLICLIRLSF